MYLLPIGEAHAFTNRWTAHFTSAENRHALPLFTSLLNFVCSYDPAGILPYNHLIFQVNPIVSTYLGLQANGQSYFSIGQMVRSILINYC